VINVKIVIEGHKPEAIKARRRAIVKMEQEAREG